MCAAKAVAGELESVIILGVASIFRAEAPVKPAAVAHARHQRVVQQLSGAPHGFRRTFARQPSKLRHRGEHDKDHGGPPWGQGSPRIYITTADAAVRLQEQPALEPPARCRADNPRRPAGSGRHVGYLGARADAAIPTMNDHLTWLGRIFEASSVPLRQELFKRGRARMLRKRHCFNRQSSPEKHRSP